MARKVLSHSNNVWFKSSRECMIFKDDNLEIDFIDHNKIIGFVQFDIINDCLVTNFICCDDNKLKKVLRHLVKYLKKYNKKIIFENIKGNKKEVFNLFFKKNGEKFIYEI